MGNTLCGSVVVPNAHTQDDATDSLSLRSFYGKNYVLQIPFCAIMRSWTLLAAFGGSYAPDNIYGEILKSLGCGRGCGYARYARSGSGRQSACGGARKP